LEVGLAAGSGALFARLVLQAGQHPAVWTGPRLALGRSFDLVIAFHPGMGPGGCLVREDEKAPWSSMATAAAGGMGTLRWPELWSLGCGPSGAGDRPFLGDGLEAFHTSMPMLYAGST